MYKLSSNEPSTCMAMLVKWLLKCGVLIQACTFLMKKSQKVDKDKSESSAKTSKSSSGGQENTSTSYQQGKSFGVQDQRSTIVKLWLTPLIVSFCFKKQKDTIRGVMNFHSHP